MFGSPFRRLQVRSSHYFWCLPPVGEVGSVACVGFLVEGTGACVLVGGAVSCPSGGRAVSSGVFWSVCELSMTLGSLSANGWGCVPASCLAWGFQHWSLLDVGWRWVLVLRGRCLGEFSPIDITWGGRFLVVQCPGLGSPTSEAQA